jgi:hypothetical protein
MLPFVNVFSIAMVADCLQYMWARGGVWLRHYAKNRQVVGSIPDGVIGIFQ